MFKYQTEYELKCHQKKFIKYPKGGYSDNPLLDNEKLRGYFYLLLCLSKHLKVFPSIFCIKKILSQLKNNFKNHFIENLKKIKCLNIFI